MIYLNTYPWLIRLVKEVLHCNGQSHWVSPVTREVDEISWGKSNISLYTLFVISCWRIRCSPTRLLRQNIDFLFVYTNELPMSIHKHGMRTIFSILSALQRVNDSWFHSEWGKFSKRHERVCFIQLSESMLLIKPRSTNKLYIWYKP